MFQKDFDWPINHITILSAGAQSKEKTKVNDHRTHSKYKLHQLYIISRNFLMYETQN